MFNLKDLGDISKMMEEAKGLQRHQEQRHQEQLDLLKQIASLLEQILAELKNKK
jgi:hypothetical protein